MKLLHTSDWHLGRMFYNQPRADDHDAVIAEILDIARQQKPDLVLHTGDLFDVVRPGYTDIHRGLDALNELGTIAPVVVICGNHDSAQLFQVFQRLQSRNRTVTFVDRARHPSDGGILDFESTKGERIRLAPLPFVHQNRLIDGFDTPENWNAEYVEHVRKIEHVLGEGLLAGADPSRDVRIFAAHLHVGGATYSGSERGIHVTDAYATRAEHLPIVDYAAFGHIHKPQRVPGTTVGRYAGSPIQLDMGEEGEQKQVVLVEASPGRPPEIIEHPLKGGRQLRRVSGSLEQIASQRERIGNALCVVTVNTPMPIPDLSRQVRELLPAATILEVHELAEVQGVSVVTRESLAGRREPTTIELFSEYLVANKVSGATKALDVFTELLNSVTEFRVPEFAEETAFAAPLPAEAN